MIANFITQTNTNRDQFNRYCKRLSNDVQSLALAKLREHGFYGLQPMADDSQCTLQNVKAAIHSRAKLFPVYSGSCDRTVYTTPVHNMMFRAWHDLTHYEMNCGIDYRGEHLVSQAHIAQFDGVSRDIMRADTLGQLNYFHYTKGHFVADQRGFAFDYLHLGESAAILKHSSKGGN